MVNLRDYLKRVMLYKLHLPRIKNHGGLCSGDRSSVGRLGGAEEITKYEEVQHYLANGVPIPKERQQVFRWPPKFITYSPVSVDL